MPNIVKRIMDITARVETREGSGAEAGKRYIEGLIPFNSRSEVIWDFVEEIDPTAFNKTMADGANVYAFWAHDDAAVLASRDAKTLALEIRPEGLHFAIDVREDSLDKFAAVQRGDVVGVSFGFITRKDEWDFTAEPAVRRLKEVQLLEVSPGVAFPAYPGAQSSAATRSLELELEDRKAHIAEMRAASKSHTTAPKNEKPLEATPEPPEALESRNRAELAILRARIVIG
jgi:uncharacterized protein